MTFPSLIGFLSNLFLLAIGFAMLAIVVLYVIDVTQTQHAIRRNFPVIGRLRYWFEHLGQFFRQYFYALDREEMPFNRAQRSWVYRAAKGEDNTVAFGSTLHADRVGAAMLINSPYPVLDADGDPIQSIVFGADCEHPYETAALFGISAMSYGAISRPAVQALSAGAAEAGIWLNTGEGGLSPYHLEGGADLVFQIGTAKYGVRDERGNFCEGRYRQLMAHDAVKMCELKLAQGAKPGKGGILPAAKVNREVAEIRGISLGQDSISPNRHVEIANDDELLDFVERLRAIGGKPVGIKIVVGGHGSFERLLQRINDRGLQSAPDFITVDSGDGGTGAAPMSLMDNMGLTIEQSLPMVIDALEAHGLRKRIRVIASGKLINPVDVAWALSAGADCVQSARGFMLALGCIQAMQCNKNTCPTGITTHDRKLQRGLVPEDKARRVARYAKGMHKELETIAHACGVSEPRQLTREHCAIVQDDGLAVDLATLYDKSAKPGRKIEPGSTSD
ncbi:MAG: FMN-binding glutamate synthase family protein [Pseudomonadota bacterium]